MHSNKLFSILILSLFSTFAFGQLVNNESQLNNAINGASAGTTIILADGIWNNVFIDIDKNGTLSNPITITSQTPGGVFMTGNSRVYMEGNYVYVTGLIFQDPSNLGNGSSTIDPIIELRDCNYCQVTNNRIEAYNGTENQKDLTFKWVLNDGQYNEIAYNSFIGKYGVGSIINDNRNSDEPDYLKIHHNYFADRTPINELNEDNDQDAIRIGSSSSSLDNSFSEIYNNYFFNFFGEIEVISNKSGGNKYYNNTFRDYAGTLALRHGNGCEVNNNYFFAENNEFSGGIRVIGENHRIYNNYIEGVNSIKPNGSESQGTGGINVSNGRPNTALNGYFQVKNTEIVNNTFVNCDYGLRIGTEISSNLVLAPEDLIIANNITFNSSEDDFEILTAPIGSSSSQGNILDLPESSFMDDGNFHRLTNNSAAISAGVGNYDYLTQDILGGNRADNYDAGAEEFGANGFNLPYTGSDVGVNVGFGGSASSLVLSTSTIDFGVCGGNLPFNILSNVDWTITENSDWLSFDITDGSGSLTLNATTTENTSGANRTANVTINETGGTGAIVNLSVTQSLNSIAFNIPIIGTTAVGTQQIPTVSEENAYNGDNTNYWTGNPDTEPEVAITFDLGSAHVLDEIGINFWKADERTTTFSIAISENTGGPFTTVLDHQLSADGGVTTFTEQMFNLGNVLGRYVKFIGHGNSSATNWTSISDVNIYGDLFCNSSIVNVFNTTQAAEGITLFPVPTSNGILNISSESNNLNTIAIFNTHGQQVMTVTGNNDLSKQIDVTHLDRGIYFVKFDELGFAKFVIQ